MEVFQSSDFTVRSSIHDYKVAFIKDIEQTVLKNREEGDVIIVDHVIKRLYNSKLDHILSEVKHISIEATEVQKSYQGIMPVINELIESGFKKNHRLIAIGGGITQDVTAFIASILYRGVDWLFYPTTLLAQGDSCIGSKTSINFDQYKNQVGGFYPPRKVYIDLRFLDTLPDEQLRSGIGEMSHYFVIAGKEEFDYLKNSYPKMLKDKALMESIIAKSLQIKKSYIEIDEYDRKERQIFNYGHSFGHAIESITNYRIPHGIAVSIGMDMANYVSVKEGYIPAELRDYIRSFLAQIWEGFALGKVDLEKYKQALLRDKKNVGSELRLILNKGFGQIFKTGRKLDDEFASWLKAYFDTQIQ